MKHILVGIDFSETADRALAYAEEIALIFSSKISLIHIHKQPADGLELIEATQKSTARRANVLPNLPIALAVGVCP
jgi:nucleotide-binding universal stress UspA family protein